MKAQKRKAAETQRGELDFAPARLVAPALNQRHAPSPIGAKDNSPRQRPEYFGGFIKWAKSGDLNDGVLRDTEETITDEGLAKSNTKKCPPGTLLVALYGATTGKVALLEIEAAINQAICALVSNAAADSEFLMYALTHRRTALLAERYGGAQPNISQTVLRAFGLPVPPLPEQRAIAGVLRTVQGAKEACEGVLAATRQLKQSLLHHLFTYGHVPFPQAAHVQLKETEIGEVAEHWLVMNLEMLKAAPRGAIVSGPFGSNIGKRFFVSSGVPLIRGCNLTTGKAFLVEDGFVFITEEKAQELANCTALPGDLIFTAAGTIGQVGLIPEKRRYPKYVISNKQLRARVDNSRADPLFLFYWFTQPRMQAVILERKGGTSIPVINLSVLRSLPIGLPPVSEQREIARQLAAVDAKLAALASRRTALAALFTSLLHHLLTARLRLPEFVK